MTHNAKTIAEFFLKKGKNEGVEISPMKLQKLIYYAHGWHLSITDNPLINEQIECWNYGPVIRSIYHHFKYFGNKNIDYEFDSDEFDDSNSLYHNADKKTVEILEAVWNAYKKFTAIQLSNMSHEAGAPWDLIMVQNNNSPLKGTDIPIDIIKSYFKKLASK